MLRRGGGVAQQGGLRTVKVLVTGGAGFIGSHVVAALVSRGCSVVVLDNLTTGSVDSLPEAGRRIRLVEGDVRDPATVDGAARGCAVVIHLAALVSVPACTERPAEAVAHNELGTIQVAQAAAAAGARRLVLASSAAVYGSASVPHGEETPPKPQSVYAVSKLAAELHSLAIGERLGLSVVCLRFFNVYGPRQHPASPYSGVIARFISAAAEGTVTTIHGDGRQTRDFVYVGDVAEATVASALAAQVPFRVMNIGTGQPCSIAQLWRQVARSAGLTERARTAPARSGDVRHSVAAVDRARTALGFRATTGLEAGLEATLAWYREAAPGDGRTSQATAAPW